MNIFDKIRFRLSVRHKIYLALFSIVVVFLTVGTVAMFQMQKTIKQEKAQLGQAEIERLITKHYIGHMKWMAAFEKYLLNPESGLDIEIDYEKCELGKWLKSKQRDTISAKVPELEAHFEKLNITHKDLHNSVKKISTFIKFDKISKAQDIYNSQTQPLFKKSSTHFESIIKTLSENYDKESLRDNTKLAVRVMLFGMLITIGFAFFMAFIFSNDITNPLKKIIAKAKQMSEGDFSKTMPVDRKDEFGEVYGALNQMIMQLQNVLEGIKDNVNHFVSTGKNVNISAKSISNEGKAQSQNAMQLASQMEKMNNNIEQSAFEAGQTEEIAYAASLNAKNGSMDMKQATEMLKTIAKKSEVISHIAFQTNILSLNAAIEAARAGKAGESFSVVAGEVGDLAEKSQFSAEEIEYLTGDSTEIADKAAELLNSLMEDIEKTYQLISSIAGSSQEQRKSSEQINVAILELNKIVQRNASSAETLAEDAMTLSEHADMLKEMIAFFKVS